MSKSRIVGLCIAVLSMTYATAAYGQTITVVRDFGQAQSNRFPAGVRSFVLDGTDIYVNLWFPFYPPSLGKYGADGKEYWVRPFLVPGRGRDVQAEVPGGLAVTPHGIYITASGTSARGDWNIFLRKYASDGAAIWMRELDFITNDRAGEVAADATGVYVTGQLATLGIVRKYDFDGVEQWTRKVSDDAEVRVIADSSGLYVAAGRVIRKYDASGNEIWSLLLGERAGIARLNLHDGVLFAVGTDFSAGPSPSFLRAFTLGGDPMWERRFGPDFAAAVAADASGIYVGGAATGALKGNCRHGNNLDGVIRKFEADGAESWATQFAFYDSDNIRTVAVTNSTLYAAGWVLVSVDKNPASGDPNKPQIQSQCVVNAANLIAGGVAPGEMVTIIGTRLGPIVPVHPQTQNGIPPTRIAETSVFFDGIAAPLISVSDKQNTVIVPYEITGRSSVSVEVDFQGARSDVTTVPVFLARPGIFTRDGSGRGQAEVFNENGTPNSASNPAPKGSIITFYVTGEGLIDPPVATGSIIDSPIHRPRLNINVLFDNGEEEWSPGELISAVEKTGSPAGVLEVRARVSKWAMFADAVPFFVNLESPPFQASSPGVSVAISETRIARDIVIGPEVVSRGGSFKATVTGPNFDNETYVDVRYRRPSSNVEEVAFNWQVGGSATHTVPLDAERGTWTITGIRAHSNLNDRSGEFLPVFAAVEID